MTRVVFDTNIYISAFNYGGTPHRLLHIAAKNKFQLYISPEITNEVISVQTRKFHHSPTTIAQIKELFSIITQTVEPTETISVITSWPPDNRILECAIAAQANYLVTGDKKHLLPLKKHRSVTIITPEAFLPLINK